MEITTYNFKTFSPKKNFYQNSKIYYEINKNKTKLNSYIRNLNKLSLNNISLKSSEEDKFLNNYESELNNENNKNKIIKSFKSNILKKIQNDNKNNRTKQSYDSFNKFLNRKLIKNLKSPIKILNNNENNLKNKENIKSFSTGKSNKNYYNNNSNNNNNNNKNIIIPKLFITSTNLENENTLNYTISNNFNNNNNNIFSPSKSITSYNFYTPFNKNSISRNSHHTKISSFFSTLNNFNIKKIKLKFLTKDQIKKKYPKKNFQKIFKELDYKTLQTEKQQKNFYNKTLNVIPYTKIQDEKLLKEQKEMEDLLSTEREKKPAEKIAKPNNSGYISMLNKNIFYLMEFGDNYLKFSDENFYPRRKEIMKKYETIQQKADVDVKNEKIVNNPRIKALNKNHLILIKKFYNLKQETKEIDKMKNDFFSNEKNNEFVNKNINNKNGF